MNFQAGEQYVLDMRRYQSGNGITSESDGHGRFDSVVLHLVRLGGEEEKDTRVSIRVDPFMARRMQMSIAHTLRLESENDSEFGEKLRQYTAGLGKASEGARIVIESDMYGRLAK